VNAYSLTPFIFQLRFASLDLELHTKYIPGASESIYEVDRRVSKRTQVIPPLPEDRFLCGFSHIFAGLLDYNVYMNLSFNFASYLFLVHWFLLFVNTRWLCSWILQLQGTCWKTHTVTTVNIEKDVAMLAMLILVQVIVGWKNWIS
jgi:hypothetical protein